MKKTHKLLAVMIWLGSAQANAETPRTLANGGPACGNTMTKGGDPPACQAVRAVRWAERSLATAKAELAAARLAGVAETAKARAEIHEVTRVLVTARLALEAAQPRGTEPQDLALTVPPAARPPS